jgi:hypothetical protein
MKPPDSMMCQECPWYKSAHEDKSGWMTFLSTYNNLQKEEAIKNGKYKEAFKTIINKYGNKLGWNIPDEDMDSLLEDLVNCEKKL